MIGFLLTVASIFACGLAVAKRFEAGPAERITAGAVIGIAIWLAASWILALLHLFTRPALIAVAVLMALAAIFLRPTLKLRPSLLFIPLGLFVLFALWKASVLPPQSHDALAYHLPKAAMIAQSHGWEHFAAPDPRITSLPANYELLVAAVFVMSGGDALTEWIGTISFILFLCATAAVSERWWGEKAHRAATVLAAAGAPVLLLHATADKNDVMACFFAVCALMWAARWSVEDGRMPMILVILSLAMAGGTKPNAAAVAVAIVPFILLRWRSIKLLDVALAVLAFFLLGGVAYLPSHAAGAPMAVQVASVKTSGGMTIQWGDFEQLWQVPYLMLTVPFVQKANAVWVPWRHEYWYWPHYEIFFSHYGALITILTILALFCAWRVRDGNRERRVTTIAALIAAALLLPTHMPPTGMFAAMPRYLAFVVPVIVCWSVPPLIEILRARSLLIANTFVAAIVAFFAVSAIDCALSDTFAPWRFLMWAARHPGTRHIWFMPNRAASVADRSAGPDDTIAIDGSFDTWAYPAYGAHLTRHVIFLPQPATPESIPPSAQWVLVDRSWDRIWEHPGLTDMGKFWQYVGRGKPRGGDERLLLALEHDPRFSLVFYDPRLNQAVFRRVR